MSVKWVIFSGEGRLGNQIIQSVALRKLFPSAYIAGLSCKSMSLICNFEKFGFAIKWKFLEKLVRVILSTLIFRPLSKNLRLMWYCTESTIEKDDRQDMSGAPVVMKGLLPICFAEKCYFQNFTNLLDASDFVRVKVKACHQSRIEKKNIDYEKTVVIHVRRGDYVGYTTNGINDVTLKPDYYLNAFKQIKCLFPMIDNVLIVTDDVEWCNDNLKEIGEFSSQSESEADDFAILSKAKFLICSNSTFSLSAALISTDIKFAVLPKYWLGCNSNFWAPRLIAICDARFLYV